MSDSRMRLRGALIMTASAAIFAAMSALVRYAGEHLRIDSFKMALFRFGIGMAILGVLAVGGKIKLVFQRNWLLLSRGVTGGAAVFLYFLSINWLSVTAGNPQDETVQA